MNKEDVKDGFDFLEYPLEFKCKAMCRVQEDVQYTDVVMELVANHLPRERILHAQSANSRTGKFESVTVSMVLHSRDELENVYKELAESEHVVMTL